MTTTSHHLDHEGALVRRRSRLQPIDRFERRVEGGVDAYGDIGAVQIVVDGRSDADDGEPGLRKGVGARERAVAADHDETFDRVLLEYLQRALPPFGGAELGAAGAAEHGAADVDDAGDVAGPERLELALDQPGVALSDAGHLEPARHTDAHHGPERRVHPRRVAPTRQHCNPLHPSVVPRAVLACLVLSPRIPTLKGGPGTTQR